MPRKPVNYDTTYFHKIVCKDINIEGLYVGHTTNFTKRRAYHRQVCLNENSKWHNLPLYQHIRENGNWENFDMILLSQEKCENSLQARRKY